MPKKPAVRPSILDLLQLVADLLEVVEIEDMADGQTTGIRACRKFADSLQANDLKSADLAFSWMERLASDSWPFSGPIPTRWSALKSAYKRFRRGAK